MQNLLDHEYKKNNYTFLLLKNIHPGSKYYSILRDNVQDISYKFLENNRIILVDEGQTAIFQLESFMSICTVKILYLVENVDANKIIVDIISYIVDTIKLLGLETSLVNSLNFRIYFYHYDPLINLQYIKITNTDIFGNKLGYECNEYFTNLNFDQNFKFH